MESLAIRLTNLMKNNQPVHLTLEEFAFILNMIQCGAKLEILEDLEHIDSYELLNQSKNEFVELTKTETYNEIFPFIEETGFFKI